MKQAIQWTDTALTLYAQSESNSAGIQMVKLIKHNLESIPKLFSLESEVSNSLEDYLTSSIQCREQSRRSLIILNPDVNVEFLFPSENRTHKQVMSYSLCQQKMVEWAKNNVSIKWWPVNFATHDEAKQFSFNYLDTMMKSLVAKPVEA